MFKYTIKLKKRMHTGTKSITQKGTSLLNNIQTFCFTMEMQKNFPLIHPPQSSRQFLHSHVWQSPFVNEQNNKLCADLF